MARKQLTQQPPQPQRLAACSPASADSTSALSTPGTKRPGKLSSTQTAARCLRGTSQAPTGTTTCAPQAHTTLPASMSSQPDSPAKTSAAWAQERALPERAQASSGKSAASPKKYGPSGWCLKTSWACSTATLGKTLARSSKPSPSAGMWDVGGCLILNISESPKAAVGFSWSQVLDANPPLGCWLTPRQWTQYLARLRRHKPQDRQMDGLPIVCLPKAHQASSPSVARLLSVTEEDGVRWLSGPECLMLQGFPSDWMRATTAKLGRPETQYAYPWQDGLPST